MSNDGNVGSGGSGGGSRIDNERSILQYPFDISEGIITWLGKVVGFFTEEHITITEPLYDEIFPIVEAILKGYERRKLVILTRDAGYNRVMKKFFEFIREGDSYKGDMLRFSEGWGDLYPEDEKLIELTWKWFFRNKNNVDFAKKLLKLKKN